MSLRVLDSSLMVQPQPQQLANNRFAAASPVVMTAADSDEPVQHVSPSTASPDNQERSEAPVIRKVPSFPYEHENGRPQHEHYHPANHHVQRQHPRATSHLPRLPTSPMMDRRRLFEGERAAASTAVCEQPRQPEPVVIRSSPFEGDQQQPVLLRTSPTDDSRYFEPITMQERPSKMQPLYPQDAFQPTESYRQRCQQLLAQVEYHRSDRQQWHRRIMSLESDVKEAQREQRERVQDVNMHEEEPIEDGSATILRGNKRVRKEDPEEQRSSPVQRYYQHQHQHQKYYHHQPPTHFQIHQHHHPHAYSNYYHVHPADLRNHQQQYHPHSAYYHAPTHYNHHPNQHQHHPHFSYPQHQHHQHQPIPPPRIHRTLLVPATTTSSGTSKSGVPRSISLVHCVVPYDEDISDDESEKPRKRIRSKCN